MTKVQIALMLLVIIGLALFIFVPGVGMLSYISAGLCVVGLLGNVLLSFIHFRKLLKEQEKAEKAKEEEKAE